MSTHVPNRYERVNQVWNAVSGAHSPDKINWPLPVKTWGQKDPANAYKLARLAMIVGRRHRAGDMELVQDVADSVSWGDFGQ